jgi:tRNA-2-methylthio-N6-dimethylallyladenosine synthase
MLLGQNVNSYGKDLGNGIDFIGLLGMIDRLDGKKKISFMTSHPKDASSRLFEAIRDLAGLSKDLHLPLQSGSDKILKAMNRGYDPGYYYDLVARFRKIVPSGSLTTDVIVGFPGETEEDFAATKKMMQELEFDASFIFKYSPRPPAPSAGMEDDVPRKVKEERHAELLKIQRAISKKKVKH